MYLSSKDNAIYGYLDRAHARKDKTVRKLSHSEFSMILEFREIEKTINLCMTEMVFTKVVICKLKINDLKWVVNNFQRIISSLKRQKDLLISLRLSLAYCKPTEKEVDFIKMLSEDVRKRIDYLNRVPIPENIRLTPIQDYMDLLGADAFVREVKTVFPSSKDLYQAQKDGEIEKYLSEMLDTLEKVGKQETYKERLEQYVSIIQKRKEKEKAEKKAEQMAIALNESQNGIDLFRELFFKGIRNIKGIEKIGLTHSAIAYHLIHGHRGKFCVLCCGLGRDGRLMYRYMKKTGEASKSFQGCALYDNVQEAADALKEFQKIYPDRAFSAVAI